MSKLEDLESMFFGDLKSYNSTNYRTLIRSNLSSPVDKSKVHKAFSSVVTRYFIFVEKHSEELTESEFRQLYFSLKIDLISQYFAEYPNSDMTTLSEFQDKLRNYGKKVKTNEQDAIAV